MDDLLADFDVVEAFLVGVRREDALVAASVPFLVLVEQLSLLVRILGLDLIGLLEAIQHPFLLLVVSIIQLALFLVLGELEHFECIGEKPHFDPFVKRSVRVEGRRLIYFKQPGPRLRIQQDIKSQDFKAH